MTDAGGAAFNPAVRTEDNAPAPEPEEDRAEGRELDETGDCRTTGEDHGNGVR